MRRLRIAAIAVVIIVVSAPHTAAYAFGRVGCFQAPAARRPAADVMRALNANLMMHLPAETRACNFYARGLLYHLEGDLPRAIADYTSALRWMNSFGAAYAARADAYEDQGEQALAESDYAQDNLHSSDSPQELTERCWIRALRGHPLDRALTDCDSALKEDPDDFNALASRALVNLRLHKDAATITDCDAALKQMPANATALYLRALAKLHLGDTAGGSADLAAAKTASAQVEDTFALYGVRP